MNSESIISVRHLRKEYESVTPLKDVNCEIKRGEVISIIGPSGTGKSTFLRSINRLETPTSGEIFVNGVNILDRKTDIYKVRLKMGMVFQNFNLFSHMTVIENIMLGPVNLLGFSRQQAHDEGMELLKTVGLAEKAMSFPDELSGGQKQRVAIARTLAMHPDIILFDEPTSALDPTMVGEVLSVIRLLAKQGLTMLIVTHEMKFAHDVSTRVFYMDEGVIYEDGTPSQVFDNPLREKTRAFVKRLKSFTRTITTPEFDFIGINNDIEEFCRSLGIEHSKVTLSQLAFEELCVNKLIPALGESFKLDFAINYLEVDNAIEISVSHDGVEFDPLKNGDDLSTMILSKIAKNLKVESNRITFYL